ncbi:MAG: bifunctional precorrin-2 dehydrogenase/sirohydrochlorin ferrochelatase [Selenomonadaceae bacterium]
MYPINLSIKGRRCAVVGGGRIAQRKVKTLLCEGAAVVVIAPRITEEISTLHDEGKIIWKKAVYTKGSLQGFFIIICATDDAAVNAVAAAEAKALGALVNVVEPSDLSNFMVPAQVRRGNLLLTVSTGGRSPAFSRQLKHELELSFGDTYGIWLEILAGLRLEMKERLENSCKREEFWRYALDAHLLELVKQGKFEKAEAEIRNAISSFGTES